MNISMSQPARAMTLDWTGGYRIELNEIDSTTLGDPKGRKSYLLNQLYLSPKIIASDGINIISRFEVLPSRDTRYQNSQLGQFWGPGVGSGSGTNDTDTNTRAQNQPTSQIAVSQLYLNINQEFGSMIVGRAPMDFGLGIRHNGGFGAFDHWYDTRDLIGYKIVMGNLFIMPMLARSYSGSIEQGTQINDQMIHLQYENLETGSLLGIFYETRKGALGANDTPVAAFGGSVVGGEYSEQNVNVLLGRDWSGFGFKIEAGFTSGASGVFNASNEEIRFNSYGIATEFDFKNKESRWHLLTRIGVATGDNPTTKDYEGYAFDRNYDVAMLLFNHPLGKADFLRSSVSRNTTQSFSQSVDDESISNVAYISPRLDYHMGDQWNLRNTFTYAQLMTDPIVGADVSKNLGFEWDIGVIYKPHEKIQWVNEVGLLFPGEAFKGGTNNYSNSFTYGFASKAAITF